MKPKSTPQTSTSVPAPTNQPIDSIQGDEYVQNLIESRQLVAIADAALMSSANHPTTAIRDVTEKLIAHAGVLIATDHREHWLAASELIGRANQLRRIQASGSRQTPLDDSATSAAAVAPSNSIAPGELPTTTAKHERVIGLLMLYLQHLAGVKGLRGESTEDKLFPRPPPMNLFAFGPRQKVNASELARQLHQFAHNRADRKAENKLNPAAGLDEETIRKVLGASLKRFDQPVAEG